MEKKGYPFGWDTEKVLCFHDTASTIIEIEVLHSVNWDLNLTALNINDFYLLAFNSKYTCYDNLPAAKRNYLTRYSNDANVFGAIEVGCSPTNEIGDFIDLGIPAGFNRNVVWLDSDKYYDFHNTPILIQGSHCSFQAMQCVSGYIPEGEIYWVFDIIIKVGLLLRK